MIKAKGKVHTIDGVLFCFLAAVIIAVAGLNIGVYVEPGKIIPTGLSMRSGEMSMKILKGIDYAIEDIGRIRSGNVSDLWHMLTFVHMDPFFYLALILPKAATKIILIAGYYIRFGLCCSAMYYFMSVHLKLRRLASALLAAMYVFSTQIIYTAQVASLMNMSVMLPVVMSCFDSYMQKRTWKSFFLVCISSFGLCITGGYGVLIGIPSVILISLLMSISLYSTFKMAFTSWLKILGGIISGLACSMVFVIPGLVSMKPAVNIAESFDKAKVNYTVFDVLRGTFLLRSGSLYTSNAPLFYVGIFTLIAVVLFAVNERIPVRIKVASAVIASVIHISCASSFVNEVLSFYGTSPLINSAKLIGLEMIIFFVAAIGLKNLNSLGRGDFIAGALIPLAFLVVSNNAALSTSLSSSIIICTFLGIIVEASLIYALAKDRLNGKAKIAVLLGFLAMIGINTAFIMFNNTLQNLTASEYFTDERGDDDTEKLILDNGFDLPAVCDGDKYLLVPADLSGYEAKESLIRGINFLSDSISDEVLFEKIYLDIQDIGEFEQEGLDEFMLKSGTNSLRFEPFTVTGNERIFVYCNSSEGASLKIDTAGSESERVFNGPFLTELNAGVGKTTLEFNIESEVNESCHISLYKLNENALKAMNSVSGDMSSRFVLNLKGATGVYTLVLPNTYDPDSEICVNGVDTGSYEYCGKTAVTFIADGSDIMEITYNTKASGILPGALISAFAAACLIVIPVSAIYNKKKKSSGEGNSVNA